MVGLRSSAAAVVAEAGVYGYGKCGQTFRNKSIDLVSSVVHVPLERVVPAGADYLN